MQIYRSSHSEQLLFNDARHANTFLSRFKGLLGSNGLDCGQALLITPCNSVHTIGMRFPIDIAFLDRQGKILKLVHNLKPQKLSMKKQAACVLEMPVNSIEKHKLELGESLSWSE